MTAPSDPPANRRSWSVEPPDPIAPVDRSNRTLRALLAGALAALVVVLLAVVSLATDDGPVVRGIDELPAGPSPGPVAPSTTAPVLPGPTADPAMVVESFFAARAAGDSELLDALLSDSLRITGFTIEPQFIRGGLVRSHARGDRYLDETCDRSAARQPELVDLPPAVPGAQAVICTMLWEPYVVRSLGLPGIPMAQRFDVSEDGIERIVVTGENPFSNDDLPPRAMWLPPFGEMMAWLADHEPDTLLAIRVATSSIDQGRMQGLLDLRSTDRWVAFLNANDCEWDDGCV